MQYIEPKNRYDRSHFSTKPVYMADFQRYLSRVFLYMFSGLAITALVAFLVSHSPKMLAFSINMSRGWNFLIPLFVYLALVLSFDVMIARANTPMALLLFTLYSVVNGFQFSFIAIAFSMHTIWMAFLSAAVLFATMSVYGIVTKRDLSKMSRILFCGLIAITIMTFINILILNSTGMDIMLSIFGVVVFSAYTAYDIFRLRALYRQNIEEEQLNVIAVYGAFMLYLDFIYLFLYLLRLFGRRRD